LQCSKDFRLKKQYILPSIFILVFASIVGTTLILGKMPFVQNRTRLSIGIYEGDSPFLLYPHRNASNPVLTYKDITDVKADFVADPFMVQEGDTWHMFIEVFNSKTYQGDIGLATSRDGTHWNYKHIVLDESFHLSYPYVFKWENEYYMIPESYHADSLRLYKATKFPYEWEFRKTLLKGHYIDSSIFRYDGKWWIFTATTIDNCTLRLFYATDLDGSWMEHPKSPIVKGDAHIARPGGRVLVLNNKIYRFAQDDYPEYGNKVLAFEITELTTETYKENEMKESPILKAGKSGWNRDGMHQIDVQQNGKDKWIACVDGISRNYIFSCESFYKYLSRYAMKLKKVFIH
jgi:hypothetical protein